MAGESEHQQQREGRERSSKEATLRFGGRGRLDGREAPTRGEEDNKALGRGEKSKTVARVAPHSQTSRRQHS